jgi:hypothetical protein
MKFKVIPINGPSPVQGRDIGYLWTEAWDDWYAFNTLYFLSYFDIDGVSHDIGGVKIGQFGMVEGQKRPDLPTSFKHLMIDSFLWGRTPSITRKDEGLVRKRLAPF